MPFRLYAGGEDRCDEGLVSQLAIPCLLARCKDVEALDDEGEDEEVRWGEGDDADGLYDRYASSVPC